MVGSAILVEAWRQAFNKFGVNVGQILVTYQDIEDRVEGGRLKKVIKSAIQHGIVPIINENDVLSDIELARLSYGGDNDGLASKIAVAVGATELMLLTNVDGLLDKKGKTVSVIDSCNIKKALMLTNGKSSVGRGGMQSKIEAAVQANWAGVKTHIGSPSANYESILSGKSGTSVR